MTDSIEVETVAEVPAVHRQCVQVAAYPATEDEPAGIQLSQARQGWGDLQFISFPADKAEEVIAAIRTLANHNQEG
jgi:hypothetical protein